VLTPPEHKQEIRRHFGDTARATAELSYVSLGIGMVLGILLGLIPIPLPGVGIVTLGMAGGPLVAALVLAKLRRTGPLLWVMPLPANIVMCNLGLALFLAAVGINAGQPFVRTIMTNGGTMLFVSITILSTTLLVILLVGRYLMRIPHDDLIDVAWGVTRNPIPVHSARAAANARADAACAMIFPTITIVNVIMVQIAGLSLVVGAG
jgi:putative transport protein